MPGVIWCSCLCLGEKVVTQLGIGCKCLCVISVTQIRQEFIRNIFDPGVRNGGRLADIAPSMLKILGLPQPAEMTGESIIK